MYIVQLYMYSTWAARTYIGAKQIVKLNKFKKKIWKYRPLLVQTYIKLYIDIYCIIYIEVELVASSRQYLRKRRRDMASSIKQTKRHNSEQLSS